MFLLFASLLQTVAAIECPEPKTRMQVENGVYVPVPDAAFQLRHFDALMVSTGKKVPGCLVRETEIQHGEVFISEQSLSKIFERKLQRSPKKSDIKDVKVETRNGGVVHLTGKMHKIIDLPFTIEGPLSTDGSNLILKADKIDAAKLPIKGLLGALGKHLSSIMGGQSMKGVDAKGNTLIFQPREIAHVRGHIESATATEKGLELKFSEAAPKQAPKQGASK